jgi:ABC-type dipeptide/oligopeptide/nickel transport system ATPase component
MFISHGLGVIYEWSHKKVVMRNGVIMETGVTEALFKHTNDPFTKHFLAAAQHRDDSIEQPQLGLNMGANQSSQRPYQS